MPLAVTHVLITIILVDLYRDYVAKHKKYFTLHTVFIAGFAGLLPDMDIPLNWLLNIFGASIMHRTITHTPLFGFIFLMPAFVFLYYKKHKIAVYFFVTTFGVLFHILLDFLFTGDGSGIMFFYPLSTTMLDLNLLSSFATPDIAAGVVT
ncbi:metal-dependent hydrolase [Candidatus Woesearchaeota archaeon]|nr:metal-dependent hydrolase [Candidatus Woesearchaeota archaeon]